MARVHVLTAAVLFGTTGTAQALGPDIEPLAVGTARIVVGAALLALVASVAARTTGGGAEHAGGGGAEHAGGGRAEHAGGGRAEHAGGGGAERAGGAGAERAGRGSAARACLGAGDRRLVLLAGCFVAGYQASFFAAVHRLEVGAHAFLHNLAPGDALPLRLGF